MLSKNLAQSGWLSEPLVHRRAGFSSVCFELSGLLFPPYLLICGLKDPLLRPKGPSVCLAQANGLGFLLVGFSRTITIAQLVENVKTETSKWAKTAEGGSSLFSWQSGYGIFSVSHSKRGEVDAYIRGQNKHHEKVSFKDEFRAICKRHEIEIDERYVWD